ncbi:MAG: energy transducer TonB [Bacteroidales bacterium]|nr:energy transducer TonB [Bacteroidales bacterium]
MLDIIIIRGLHKSLDKEAVRIIKKMPKWKPGKDYEGQVQDYKYIIPFSFKLPK